MTGAVDLPVDRPGHDVAGREFGVPVLADQKALSRLVAEHGALSADCLRDQEARGTFPPEHGRVELNELHVGEKRARPECDRDALPGRDRGVRTLSVEAPCASGGEDDRARLRLLHGASALPGGDRDDPPSARGLERPQRDSLPYFDARVEDATFQRLLDGEAGRVSTRVQDSRAGMRCLAAESDLPLHRVKGDAVPDQIGNASGRFVAKGPGRRQIHEAVPGADRVLEVKCRRVVGPHGRRNPALRVSSGGLFEPGLGDQGGSEAQFSTAERDVETGDSRSYDQRATGQVGHVPLERAARYSNFSTRPERRILARPLGSVAANEGPAVPSWESAVRVREDAELGREIADRLAAESGQRAVGVTDLISLRPAFYRRTAPVVPIPPERQARLDKGRAFHRMLGSRLAAEGVLEARVRRDGLVGRIDILSELPIEVKTTSALVAPDELVESRPDHIEQLGMYCGLVGCATGRLLSLVPQSDGRPEVQAVDFDFRSPAEIVSEMRRRADSLRAAWKGADVDELPRCPWFDRGCEFQGASVCSCRGDEPPLDRPVTDQVARVLPRNDVRDRIGSLLSPPWGREDRDSIGRFREILYPRRAYFEKVAAEEAPPVMEALPSLEPDFYARLTEAVESGTPGEVARLPGRSDEPEEEVVGFRGRPLLVKTSRARSRFREEGLVRRSPQYALDLGLRCAATGTESGLLVVGFERAETARDRVQVLELRFASVTPFSRLYRQRRRGLEEAIRDRNPGTLPACPDWMVTECPYRSECGCGASAPRVTR